MRKQWFIFLTLALSLYARGNGQIVVSNVNYAFQPQNEHRCDISFNTDSPAHTYLEYIHLNDADTVWMHTATTPQNTQHLLTLTGLRANTPYFFRVNSFNLGECYIGDWFSLNTGALPSALSPADSVWQNNNDPLPGFVLTNTFGDTHSKWVQLLNREGQVVWYEPNPGDSTDFSCQHFRLSRRNTVLLTSCQSFREVKFDGTELCNIQLHPDSNLFFHHDAMINHAGNYVLLTVRKLNVDKSSVGGDSSALVIAPGLVEMDGSGNVLWEWQASDHFDPLTSPEPGGYWTEKFGNNAINWLDANALIQDLDGKYVVSFRAMNQLIKIRPQEGSVEWILGGENGNIDLAPADTFVHQNSLSLSPDGFYVLMDNSSQDSVSRAMEFLIDFGYLEPMTMGLWEYHLPPSYSSEDLGSVSRLNSGNSLICSGLTGTLLELNPDNSLRWLSQLPSPSDRAYFVPTLYASQPTLSFLHDDIVCEYDEQLSLSASLDGGCFSGDYVENGHFLPSLAGEGEHEIMYFYGPWEYAQTLVVLDSLTCVTAIKSPEMNILGLTLYPNPLTPTSMVEFTLLKPSSIRCDVISSKGQTFHLSTQFLERGMNRIPLTPIHTLNLSKGIHFLSVSDANSIVHRKFILSQ